MRKQKTEIMMPTGIVTLDADETENLIQVILGRGEEAYERWKKTKKPAALRDFMEAALAYERITMQVGTKEDKAMAKQIIAKCRAATGGK